MDNRNISIYQVAELAGVSPITVARAFSGKQTVAANTKSRIIEAADQLGYRPNHLASCLRLGSTKNVGIMWSFSGPHSNTELARNFSSGLLAAGYAGYMCDTMSKPELLNHNLDNYVSRRVDGLIMQIRNAEVLTEEIRSKLRIVKQVVIVCEELPETPIEGFDVIYRDRTSAQTDILTHFVESGRRNILVFGMELSPAREKSISAVKDKYHFPLNISRVHALPEGMGWPEYTSAGFDYDAFFSMTDEVAIAVMSNLLHRGVRVPEEVAVVGFNDNLVSRDLVPPLASVYRQDKEIAQLAIKMLLERLTNPELQCRSVELQMCFIPRESAGTKILQPLS